MSLPTKTFKPLWEDLSRLLEQEERLWNQFQSEKSLIEIDDYVSECVFLDHPSYRDNWRAVKSLHNTFPQPLVRGKEWRFSKATPVWSVFDATSAHGLTVNPLYSITYYPFLKIASGIVIISGLGAGYVLKKLAQKEEVTKIFAVEISSVLCKWVSLLYPHSKIEYINDDIYNQKNLKADFISFDIHSEFPETGYDYERILNTFRDVGFFHFWDQTSFDYTYQRPLEATSIP